MAPKTGQIRLSGSIERVDNAMKTTNGANEGDLDAIVSHERIRGAVATALRACAIALVRDDFHIKEGTCLPVCGGMAARLVHTSRCTFHSLLSRG